MVPPTPWVSPLVLIPKKSEVHICMDMQRGNKAISGPLVLIPKKSGEVRICMDMRRANKAISGEVRINKANTHECYPTPTVDDLIHTLNGALLQPCFRSWISDLDVTN